MTLQFVRFIIRIVGRKKDIVEGGEEMNIGSKIKEIRESKGVTQTYILKIIGKSNSATCQQPTVSCYWR